MGLAYKRFDDTGTASSFLARTRDARTLGGGTLLVRHVNEGDVSIGTYVRLTDPALKRIDVSSDTIRLGPAVTMAQIEREPELGFLAPVARVVGGPAVRAAATIGGNLFAPSPYGDFGVALLALDASVEVLGANGAGDLPLGVFFAGRDLLSPETIVTAVSFKRPPPESFRFLKVSRVKPKGAAVLSIASVLEVADGRVAHIRIALGAMAKTPMRARALEQALTGTSLTEPDLARALSTALEGTTPASDAVASSWYRGAVLPVHLRRLLLATS